MASRTTYYVVHIANQVRDWGVKLEGVAAYLSTWSLKTEAVEDAKRRAKANVPSQVIVQRADGTFETEYTYGNDPARWPG